jgi:HD-GYP domain-containing protein (c-di-GMP phosphodiesterase class II)
MHYAQDLLEVEATSIWIKDEDTGDLTLHVATGERIANLHEVRVPANQGIIGNVTSTGMYIVVNDVDKDDHFYRGIDQKSGFTTRSILCVPLQSPKIDLGGERGQLKETIIGGAQALNKRNGRPFNEEDVALFEMLANQAATILQFSELYNHLSRLYNELALLFNETQRLSEQNYKMFWGIIKGISSFIDRKDPYTRGHSLRVSEFSVAIARQLNLPRSMIEHIQIGGILHDVGKIGVPDEVLKKPSHLTDEEMAKMKLHPGLGMKLLEESDLLWLLPIESLAIEEHHERLDGSGYPKGLRGKRKEDINGISSSKEGISLIGRIVAVADAFDAMTSDRPYRPGMTVEKALSILQEESGIGLDPMCVEALVRAREKGDILVQRERSIEHQPIIAEIEATIHNEQSK